MSIEIYILTELFNATTNHVPAENESFTAACRTVKFAAVRHTQVRHL